MTSRNAGGVNLAAAGEQLTERGDVVGCGSFVQGANVAALVGLDADVFVLVRAAPGVAGFRDRGGMAA